MASNFFNKASLVMVPDAPIDGIQPSVKPEDRSGDFTFTRGSNLAATRVNKSQLIEKGRENLILQSNQFDTTWVTPDSTITGGQADRDGGTDAWLLTATSAFHRVVQSISQSGVKRFSIYAKANVNDYLLLGCFEGAHYYATFNLATGAVDSNNINAISPSIENVGNGWYRCSATWIGGTTDVRIASQTTGGQNGWASTTSGSIYIQDAQLEQGLAATSVITTGASTVQAGILENTPRLDYSGGATCPSLLLEPSRTNLIESSEYVVRDVFGWSINEDGGITTENNSATSPEGLQNAVKLIYSGSGYSYVRRGVASGAGTTSVYVKKGNWRYIGLRNGESQSTHSVFDFDTESFVLEKSGHTLGYESVGNGWYRIWDYQPTVVSPANGFRGVAMCDANGTEGSPNTPAGSYNYVWGFQVELGAGYPTSYIPTMGSAVTRSSDNPAAVIDSSLIGQTRGTIFVEATIDNLSLANACWVAVNDGTTTNNRVLMYASTSRRYRALVRFGGNTLMDISGADINAGKKFKACLTYGDGVVNFYVNGVLNATASGDTTTTSPLNHIFLDESSQNNCKISQFAVFPTALSDDECIALTTI